MIHWRNAVAKLVHEVSVMHLHKAKAPVRAIRIGTQGIQQMYHNLQDGLFKLRVAGLLQQPEKPSQKQPMLDR